MPAERSDRLHSRGDPDVGVLFGLLDHDSVVSKLLQKPRIGRDRSKIEANFRSAQSGIQFSQGKQAFQSHGWVVSASSAATPTDTHSTQSMLRLGRAPAGQHCPSY